MQIIPIASVPAQTLSVLLGDQNCKIKIYYKVSEGLFFDLAVDDTPIVYARICRDRVKLIRYEYLGFSGDLFFADLQGTDDPVLTGLGSRFVLVYLAADEL